MKEQGLNRVAIAWGFVVLALMLLLFSCSPSKKAHKYFNDHPKEFAQDCADAFPVKESTDSSAYKEAIGKIDSLAKAMKDDSAKNADEKDIMMADIERLSNLAPNDCDSLSEAIYRYAAAETKRADKAEKKADALAVAARNVKPIEIRVENTARVEALQQQLNDCIDAGLQESREKDFWKKKYEDEVKLNKGKMVIRIPWFWIILFGGLLGIMLGLRLKGIALNPLKWFITKKSSP